MNAAERRPPRRRTSSLVGEHPAYPAYPAPVAPVPPPPATAHVTPVSPAPTGAREELAEARARKAARDAAWAWAAAARKLGRRELEWADAMAAAREAGTLPGLLREYIGEAAGQLGVEASAVPVEVWRAAGLDRP